MGLLRSIRNKMHARRKTFKLKMKGGSWRDRRQRRASLKEARSKRKRKRVRSNKPCPVTGEPVCKCK